MPLHRTLCLLCPARKPLLCAALAMLLLPSCTKAADTPASKLPRPRTVMTPKDRQDLLDLEERVTRLIPKILPSTVAIRVGTSQGTGVIVSKDGYVLTAGHVAEKPGSAATFTLHDGRTCEGKSLGAHQGVDAGLMKITDPGEFPALEMGVSEDLAPGSWCVALGHSQGYQEGRPPVARLGRILFARHSVLQTDCPLVGGDSGGPLVDLEGRVIGINSRISGLGSMNFHVAVDVYRENWDRLVKGELWQADRPARECPQILALFKPVVAEAARSLVRVSSNEHVAVMGTIVGSDGWIVTKGSELSETPGTPITCESADGRQWEAVLAATNARFDLALLKVDATDLPTPQWDEHPEDKVGRWVATAGWEDDAPAAIGVISTPRRKIPPAHGVLGITTDDTDKGCRITRVKEAGSAAKAGLQEYDVILQINNDRIRTEADLLAVLKRTQVGETIQVTVRRGHRRIVATTKLGAPEPPAGPRKTKWISSASVGVSERRDDFPMVLSHDSVVAPGECGGPLVTLDGRVVGLNIARAARSETYAIPSDVLLPLVRDMIASQANGKKQPAKKKQSPE